MPLVRAKAFSNDVNSLSHPEVTATLEILFGAALDVGITIQEVKVARGCLEIRIDDEALTRDFLSFFRETLGCPVEAVD